MNDRATIGRLPFEIIEEISQYLSVEDLTSCSAVSRGWREAFNHDRLWRPRCEATLEEVLRSTPCAVQPAFTSPEPANGSLTGLCRWRLAFMRQCHLFNNWRHGRFQKKRIHVDRNEQGHNHVLFYKFITNDKLLMVVEDRIDLWDFSVDPHIKVAETFYFPTFQKQKPTFGFSENFLIISNVYNAVTQVFCVDLVLKQITLAHIFKIHDKIKLPDSKIKNARQVVESNDSLILFNCWVVVGNLYFSFFGLHFCYPDLDVVHIWDLKAGKKVKEEPLPNINSGYIVGFLTHKTCEDVVIIMETNEISKPMKLCTYYVYSTKQGVYLPFSRTVEKNAYFNLETGEEKEASALLRKYLVLKITHDTFSIFNYESDQLLMIFKNCCYVKILSNKFIFKFCKCGITSDICSVGIFDPLKKSLITTLDIGCTDFETVGQKFISTASYNTVEVRAVGKKVEKTKTILSSNFNANELCTLVVTKKAMEYYEMYVYRFW